VKTFIFISLLFCIGSLCEAQVIYNDTPEQKRTGVYQSVWVIKTQMDGPTEIIKEKVTQDEDIKITTCVENEDGSCTPSRHFITTIVDTTG